MTKMRFIWRKGSKLKQPARKSRFGFQFAIGLSRHTDTPDTRRVQICWRNTGILPGLRTSRLATGRVRPNGELGSLLDLSGSPRRIRPVAAGSLSYCSFAALRNPWILCAIENRFEHFFCFEEFAGKVISRA